MSSDSDALGQDHLTFIVLITGLSCSGKTSLARQVSKAMACPMLSKDVFKETLADSVSVGALDVQSHAALDSRSHLLGILAEDQLLTQSLELLRSNTSHVLESVFRPEYIYDYLTKVSMSAQLVVVCLHAERSIIIDRFRQRSRHPIHNDEHYLETLPMLEDIDAAEFLPYTAHLIQSDTSLLTDVVLATIIEEILHLRMKGE